MPPYERFAAWQHCHQLVLAIYRATETWPKHELFGVTSQIRRASVSAPSNIAEGSAKKGAREFARYLDIVNGSLAEVEYFLRLSADLGYLTPARSQKLNAQLSEAAKSVWGLYAAVRRRATST